MRIVVGAVLLVACSPPPPAESAPPPRAVARTASGKEPPASSPPPASEPPSAAEAADGGQGSTSPQAKSEPSSSSNPPPLPSGTTVLHIGDSMAGALGLELNEELKKSGVRGVLRYKTASFIPTWAWSRDLPVLLANHKPDLVLITLGANEIKIHDPEIRAGAIRKLVGRFEGRPCVWIAPPLWSTDTGLLPVIAKNAAPCRYLDTDALYPGMPRLPDKIHPTMTARKDWAKRVVEWLARERKPNGAVPWELR